MHTKKIGENLFLIDLETGGFKNLIASYVLIGKKAIIVETGPTSSVKNLLSGLKEIGIAFEDVAFVTLTHVHIDHAGGVGTLLKSLPNAQVVVHERGAPHLMSPYRLWDASKAVLGDVAEMFGEPEEVQEDRVLVPFDGEVLNVGNEVKLRVIETPGHAAHNLSFYDPLNNGVFPGDSAGACLGESRMVFPTTPPPFRLDIALSSLDKLISFGPEFIFYSHFGVGSDGVDRLESYKQQLILWDKIAEEGIRKGKSVETIREKILVQDHSIKELVPELNANPVHRKTLIENSVMGFVEYARKFKV